MFNANSKAMTTSFIEVLTPEVFVTQKALTQMKAYTDNCSDEIGWLGTAVKTDKTTYVVEEMFLFKQEVHATTTEINPEGLQEFAEELLQVDGGMDVWNNIKVWGHSHVNMETFASGQDDLQMNVFSNVGHDWFIRIITNKKGSLKLDLYNYETGVVFKDMDWQVLYTQQEQNIMQQINDLYAQLDSFDQTRLAEITPQVKQEIADKVSKKSYATYNYNYNYKSPAKVYDYSGNDWYNAPTEKKTPVSSNFTTEQEYYEYNGYVFEDADGIQTASKYYTQSIYDYFDDAALKDLAKCKSYEEFKKEINTYYDIRFEEVEIRDFYEEILLDKEFLK
jgi:hypothetical protein